MITSDTWQAMKRIGITKIARELGITRANFYRWRDTQTIPDSRLLDLEKITGIPRHVLKPKIFENYTRNNNV
tara:strand:+ start:274 stop:489 length:216 start_codon:yes stop_codon:yes gene_type:complete